MIKEFVFKNLKYCLVLMVSTLVGMMLLVCVYALPETRMYDHIKDLKGSGWEPKEYLIDGVTGTYLNNYTDAFMLNTAICLGKGSLLSKANAAYSYEYTDNGVDSFLRFLDGEEGYQLKPYARYWNGYLVVLKPLLLVFTYSNVRLFNLVLQSLLLIMCVFEMIKNRKGRYCLPFLAAISVMFPITISYNLHFSVVYYLLLISVFVYEKYSERLINRLDYYFLCIGVLVTFFELSTYPMVTLLFPLVFVLVDQNGDKTFLSTIKMILSYSWAWCFGYIGIWGIKWIISSVVLDENIIGDALGQVLFRTSGANISGDKVGRAEVLLLNISDYFNLIVLGIIVAFIIAEIIYVCLCRNHEYIVKGKNDLIGLFIVFAMPAIWLIVKTNHSYIHHWMTHRELSVCLMIIYIFIEDMICKIYVKLTNNKKTERNIQV